MAQAGTEPQAGRGSATRAFVAFGANLGDPVAACAFALERIRKLPGTAVLRCSSLYRTAPVGVSGQPDYTNAVIEIETTLAAGELLEGLLAIEQQAGRTRLTRHAARLLDLDLLLYRDCEIRSAVLEVPHPRMHTRAFVLVPLAEIAPDATIPGRGKVADLLPSVANQTVVRL
jgi:2-amino-4-hydroxy-6-hydroxymethyldihydropteridine diphosphokinase